QVRGITFGGSGCPQGSNLSIPGLKSTYFDDAFEAKFGGDERVTDQRKNCQMNIAISYPLGWQFNPPSTTTLGYGDLVAGVNGLVRSTYYFSGSSDQTTTDLELTGPVAGYFSKTESSPVDLWSPCGSEGMLNINLQARITGGRTNETSRIRVDT
ncbi:hypothetical protein P152DRAFT_375135, partial [Eremomyces bilateralis CBS 781.70]